ncbi:hypothetical protein [Sutcliffiella horikoshii]
MKTKKRFSFRKVIKYIKPLDGHHYLHWTNAEEMSEHVGEFIGGS